MGAVPLSQYRSRAPGLPDLLNWGSLYAPGVVLNKDGSLLAGWTYRGPDTDAASPADRNRLSATVNAALAGLGSEWMIHVDAVRLPTVEYPEPERSHFPDAVSAAIDAERRAQFQAAGAQFETRHFLLATYLPPRIGAAKVAGLALEDADRPDWERSAAGRALGAFEAGLADLEDRLSPALDLVRLTPFEVHSPVGRYEVDPLLSHLRLALTGETALLRRPDVPMFIDGLLGAGDFWTGLICKLGDRFVAAVAIDGFPQSTHPQMLSALDQLPAPCRWSTRFIFMDAVKARAALHGYRRRWQQKVRGFMDQLANREATARSVIDTDAAAMVGEAEEALADVSSGLVGYGYYTSVVVMHDESRERLERQAREVRRLLLNMGFAARVETVNTVEAFLGSLPGHAYQNVRRPMLHTLHLANLLPLSSVWPGEAEAPCPYYPPGSPALLQAATAGGTPFRLNLHDGDLGHALMFGPSGAGKSTALALIAAQFLRYEGATVAAFDKGFSMEPITRAVGGGHYAVGAAEQDGGLCFAPLARIDEPGELAWAADWAETLVSLQGVEPTAVQRRELAAALEGLRTSASRTLTALQIAVQDEGLKAALQPYTVSGPHGAMLDAESDGIADGRWSCFEIGELMEQPDRTRIPVLLYLFRAVERQARGQPALLVCDEAWVMLGHPVFREKVRDWLKTMRKANVAVVLATQSLSDATRSGLVDVLAENTATRIFLANPHAEQAESAALYRALGLIESEIAAIRRLTPKREYFVCSEAGRRAIDLAIGPYALSFVGASSKADVQRVRRLAAEHGEAWPGEWALERGVEREIERQWMEGGPGDIEGPPDGWHDR